MMILLKLSLCLAFTLAPAFGQCDAEPMRYPKDKPLAAETVSRGGGESGLYLELTSWAKKGSEAVVLSVFVDKKYNQDVMLFAGGGSDPGMPARRVYPIFLGELSPDEHKVEVFINKGRSAYSAESVVVHRAEIFSAQPGHQNGTLRALGAGGLFSEMGKARAELMAKANAPFIYARPDAVDKFSDIPLLTYYELFAEPDGVFRVRYTTIFSNEDGGTQSKALMARWGRTVDIEWVYEMRIDKYGKIFDETYQGANHQTKKFTGRREFGSHPVLYVATDNNNFSDTGCSPMRFGLEAVEADLSNGSRETLMETHPWMYRIMADEMRREGRIAAGGKDPNTIDDPREYIYAEIYNEPKSAAVAFEVLTTDGRKFTSDLGSRELRVGRAGYSRIALHLPPDVGEQNIKAYSVYCHRTDESKNAACENLRLLKIVRLGKDYLPTETKLNFPARKVAGGQAYIFPMAVK